MHDFMYPHLIDALRDDRIRYQRRNAGLHDDARWFRRRPGAEC